MDKMEPIPQSVGLFKVVDTYALPILDVQIIENYQHQFSETNNYIESIKAFSGIFQYDPKIVESILNIKIQNEELVKYGKPVIYSNAIGFILCKPSEFSDFQAELLNILRLVFLLTYDDYDNSYPLYLLILEYGINTAAETFSIDTILIICQNLKTYEL